MKNKIIVITISVLLIIFSLFVSLQQEDKYRYHEHLESNVNLNKKYDYSNINSSISNTKEITRENIDSNLAIVSINLIDKNISGLDKKDKTLTKANFNLYDNITKKNISSLIDIRYRGNSSLKFDKKGYFLKFLNEDLSNNDVSLLGMSKNNEWALHGPYLDKTLIRNYMWYNIAGEILDYSPNCRFVEVFVDGRYEGLYLLVEKINVSKYGRLNIDRAKKDSYKTSFLLELVNQVEADGPILKNLSKESLIMDKDTGFEIKYPTQNKLTKDHQEYITNYISDFEKTLYSYDYDSRRVGYQEYIDVNSFVDYLILSEVTMNYDNGNRSTYFYKDNKGKIKLSIWDMNNTFDNFFRKTETDIFIMKDKLWFNMLLKDKKFTNKVIRRYHQLRKGVLSDEYLNNYIDETVNYLGPAIERNYIRWGNSFTEEKNLYIEDERIIGSYSEAIKQYRDTMNERLEWLDKNIESIKQFSHESHVKSYNP